MLVALVGWRFGRRWVAESGEFGELGEWIDESVSVWSSPVTAVHLDIVSVEVVLCPEFLAVLVVQRVGLQRLAPCLMLLRPASRQWSLVACVQQVRVDLEGGWVWWVRD